jgi:hypothetical protein
MGRRVPVWRWLLFAAGAAALAYGGWLLLTGGGRTAPRSTLTWLAGALLGHDAVLAPATVAAGWLLWRVTAHRPDVRRLVAAGAFVAACLVIVAAPALLSEGAPDNGTATPRDYAGGLATLLLLDAAVTAALVTVASLRRRAARRRHG